jgi:serine/threonine protein kinase
VEGNFDTLAVLAAKDRAPRASTQIRAGQVIAGRYRIERCLSRGGMGSVWVATHLELGMAVALKLMAPEIAATSEGRQRFAREAKASAAIQSPHVVKVHDYGVDGERAFLVMELLEGEDLGARLRRDGRLSLSTVAGMAVQIAKGLRRAHDAGIVHRDLKPKNLFLTRCDEDEIVQILDFGIAKLLRSPDDGDSEVTSTGVVLGSMHYMSPEQARGYKGIDHRSDLWSFGVILYRAVTGDLPFPGSETGDVLVKLCTDPIPPASGFLPEVGPEISRGLDQFFARALERDPAERFQTAREMAAAFGALPGVAVEAVASLAPPPPPPPVPPPPLASETAVENATSARVASAAEPPAPVPQPLPAPVPQPLPVKLAAAEPLIEQTSGTFEAGLQRLERRPRVRLAWGLGGAAVISVVVLAFAQILSGPDAPATSAAASAPAIGVAVSPARDTASPSSGEPGAAPSGSDSGWTVAAVPEPSASASAAASGAGRKGAPPVAPRPSASNGDRVKRKFGF